MRLSQYFLPLIRENPSEAQIVSHRLMLRAGMIRQSSAGIYSWLPLGLRVLKRVEAIVREESRKAEVLFSTWNLDDIKRGEEVWRKNGGEIITLPPAEAKRYLELVQPVATQVLSANPTIKADYEAMLAAAAKYR